jgi:hypothetical protein
MSGSRTHHADNVWTRLGGKLNSLAMPRETLRPPEIVEGQVFIVDQTQGKLTIRDGRGKDYYFHASSETLQDIKIGATIKAKLREAPKCPEK